jgi:hypothetical protein
MKKALTLSVSFFIYVLFLTGCSNCNTNQEIQDTLEIRALVDRYAVESDHYNQEAYREIFTEGLNLRIIFSENVTEIHGVEDMVKIYKAAGAAQVSFHQVGQQLVEFIDGTHAKGTTYLTALLGNEQVAQMFIRYEDQFEKIDGRWWITDRDQIIVYSK